MKETTVEIRQLGPDDRRASGALSAEAFASHPPGPLPEPTGPPPAGRTDLGAFDGGRLLGRVVSWHFASWWHGQQLPTCAVAGVAVSAEHRRGGLLRGLLAELLDAGAARGEAVSTLFPTANGIYRSLGWEVVSSYDTVELPTAALERVAPPAGLRLRRAGPDDVPAVRDLWARWAAAQNGPLTRTGLAFEETDEEFLGEHHGTTLAVDDDDRPLGYARWTRAGGYGGEGTLEVGDLVGTTGDAYRALWSMLGTFSSVAPRVRLSTSGDDPARLVLPTSAWSVVARHPYMLRVHDVAAALTASRLAVPGLGGEVPLAVRGDRLGAADGDYRLRVAPDGPATCERVDDAGPAPTFSTQGLALLFSGGWSCGALRLLGHLTGPDAHDRVLDALLRDRPVHARDYF